MDLFGSSNSMAEMKDSEGGASSDGDEKKTTDLVAALNEEQSKNAELEVELGKLLDDIDRFQLKLDRAEDEIDDLLLERKKLVYQLEDIKFKADDFYKMKLELEENRSKVTQQQIQIDDQEQTIEEQDFLIRCLEEELDQKTQQAESAPQLRESRVSKGRKSYRQSADARKDATISLLQAEIEELKDAAGPDGVKKSDLDDAVGKVKTLELEKGELELEVKCLKEALKESQDKMKQAESAEFKLNSKFNHTAERTHEWKMRAEMAEKKLESYRVDTVNKEGEGEEKPQVGDAPQALLLQSVITRNSRKRLPF